ncbi:suppressor of loss of ypt1 [Physocladia obscura]|uniref:Suppressor of loss of ypt1 n=1 Tax=Physocladia obscura TaxID=109957 RepID=A0AAD5T5Q6_9FUNG|nr:suppressor of loss of ypt1 [Physocladia obscura]
MPEHELPTPKSVQASTPDPSRLHLSEIFALYSRSVSAPAFVSAESTPSVTVVATGSISERDCNSISSPSATGSPPPYIRRSSTATSLHEFPIFESVVNVKPITLSSNLEMHYPSNVSKNLHSTVSAVFSSPRPYALPPSQYHSKHPSVSSFEKHAHWVENAKFIALCLAWYLSSSITSNIGKDLLNVFKYPLTLSWIQFLFVAAGCLIVSSGQFYILKIRHAGIRPPSLEAFRTTAPLAVFLISGHAFSSMAISRVPALSPLFTIAIYRFVFKVNYAPKVYISLLPLTLGVMLVCTNKVTFHFLGFVCALTSTGIFVVQNIVSKAIFNKQVTKKTKKMDKYNLLFYSSITSFFLMAPLWFYADGLSMLGGNSKNLPSISPITSFPNFHPKNYTSATNLTDTVIISPALTAANTSNTTVAVVPLALPTTPISHLSTADRITASSSQIVQLFLINGVSHFAQAAFSFTVLSQVSSSVTFSIASLLKRIVVIVASIVYFGEAARGVGRLQWVGLFMTFWGLWLYDRATMDSKSSSHSSGEDEEVEFMGGKKKERRFLPI